MDNPYTDDSKVVGSVVCVNDRWYYVDRIGRRPGTYICVESWGDGSEHTFTFADFESLI
jgi:hypothetical protein